MKKKFWGVIEMTIEDRFAQTDFSQLSKIKDSLLLRLKLRRRAINEEMSLEDLDMVAAAGNPISRDPTTNLTAKNFGKIFTRKNFRVIFFCATKNFFVKRKGRMI